MSIVGTRPPLISETNLYEPRHKVKDVVRDITQLSNILTVIKKKNIYLL